ncbi:MAG: hypothetical protein ACHP7D_05325 [Lysobacterales bacterium]
MYKLIHRSAFKASLIGVVFAAAPMFALAQQDMQSDLKPVDKAPDSQVELRNESKWTIQQLYFAPIGSDRWGPNQLSHNAVRTGDSFSLTGIRCDKYDAKLVDEDGDECIVRNIALCASDKIWRIGDKDLLKCQAHTPQ